MASIGTRCTAKKTIRLHCKHSFQSGTKDRPVGRKIFPSGTKEVPPGRKTFQSGTKEVPPGRKIFQSGTKERALSSAKTSSDRISGIVLTTLQIMRCYRPC